METIDVQALMRGLVHELRNPLSAILTASHLLKGNESLDEETAMLLEIVSKESRRMNRILTEFSAFVKPPQPVPEVFDLARAVRETLQEFADAACWQKITVCDELPTVLNAYADPQQIRLVLGNVLCNAVEAMEESGELHFSSVEEAGMVWLCLDDGGKGLGEGTLESAFQPFFSTKPTATGLGLPIARAAMQNNGGDMEIGNFEGGARVRLRLPAASS